VAAPTEPHVLHSRLTHSLEAAQIGRRLAEKLIRDADQELIEAVGGIDPDVVEAACLAHDLGHPPFGHVAEDVLNTLARDPGGLYDGFNGNAQTFRIITKLAQRATRFTGLDLTRATLNAVLKYPWLYEDSDPLRDKKWGAYSAEAEDFTFARALQPGTTARSIEAELMDWADDVAYAVHDAEDFFRAGLMPLHRLWNWKRREPARGVSTRSWSGDELEDFLDAAEASPRLKRELPTANREAIEEGLDRALGRFLLTLPYRGIRAEQAALSMWKSRLIDDYIGAIQLLVPGQAVPCAARNPEFVLEVEVLKELTWFYVIETPATLTQQCGQRKIIQSLFTELRAAALDRKRWRTFPLEYQSALRDLAASGERDHPDYTRLVIDMIASMTEAQAITMYGRLSGGALGSIFDHLAG